MWHRAKASSEHSHMEQKFGNTTIKVQGLQAAERKWGLATREIGIKKIDLTILGVENTKLKVEAGDA